MSLALYASPFDNNGVDNSTDNLISRKRLNLNKTQKHYNKDNNVSSEKVKNIIKKIHDYSIYNNDSIDGIEMGDFSPLPLPDSAGVNRTFNRDSFKENFVGIQDNDDDGGAYQEQQQYDLNQTRKRNQPPQQPQQPPPPPPQQQSQLRQFESFNEMNEKNQPNASNYLDNIEYNDLKNNYGDAKSVEEYYKKFSPNYNYGVVSDWNKNATSKAQSNMNRKLYSNNIDNSNFYNNSYSSLPTNVENSILLEKLNYMIHLLEEQQDERTNNVTEEVILYCFLGVFMIFIVDSFTRVGKYVR
jgi:hypothetical protein